MLHQEIEVLTERLINCESVSGHEKEIADLIERELSLCSHLSVMREGDAVVAQTAFGHKRRIILAGHIDTVPLPHLPYSRGTVPAVREGDLLYGRGATDMKAGVAVQLALAQKITHSPYDLTFIFYDHEEVAAHLNGLGRLALKHPQWLQGDFAILLEPTDGQIEGGCNGTIRVKVSATGLAAHSARAWKGKNAIHLLAGALEHLATYTPETIEVEGLAYREGLNAVHIEAGIAGNVIPDQAHIIVNYRFAPDKTVEQAINYVVKMFDSYECDVVDSAPAARPGLTHPDIQGFIKTLAREPKPKYGWTDVARFSALGIPALNFGPGDPLLAHTDDEHVSIHHIKDCYTALEKWLTT